MAKTTIPPCLEILQISSRYLDPIVPALKPGSKHHELLMSVLSEHQRFSDSADFLKSARLISYIQILMLIGLSMYGGIFMPSVKRISESNRKVLISWENGIQDTFTIGEYDKPFEIFAKLYMSKVLKLASFDKSIPTSIVPALYNILLSYQVTLESSAQRINQIIDNADQVDRWLVESFSADLLFIMLSALPVDQLNGLFTFIQRFFPDELTIKSPGGNRVNVISLFQTPSTDAHYLIEKIQTYQDLYYSSDLPVIREITRSKTRDYLRDSLKNQTVLNYLLFNLRSIKTNQIEFRQNMYQLFINHLAPIVQ